MNRYRRFFEVRIEAGGAVHLCDGDASRGGLTLCGYRWQYREPAFDPYANPYAVEPEKPMCPECQAEAHALTVASLRRHGEWFEATEELMHWIKEATAC